MRLIDADKLIKEYGKYDIEFMINKQPPIDAIPIPENVTNGEILCMMFPNMHYTLSENKQRVVTTIGIVSSFDLEWWNAPYKVESEGKK